MSKPRKHRLVRLHDSSEISVACSHPADEASFSSKYADFYVVQLSSRAFV